MKTYKDGLYKDDTTFKFNYGDNFPGKLFILNKFLEYIKEELSSHYEAIRNNFILLIKSQITINKLPKELNPDKDKFQSLSKDDELVNTLFLGLLSLSNYQKYASIDQDFQILSVDYLRYHYHFLYYLAKSVEGPLPRGEAITSFKKFIKALITSEPYMGPKTDNIADLLMVNSGVPPFFENGFIKIEFDLEDGRVGAKIEKCRVSEVMKELNDPDYSSLVCCYADFYTFTHMNENFVLTRSQDLCQNSSFCDFCFHDKTKVKELIHPDNLFWKELGSLL